MHAVAGEKRRCVRDREQGLTKHAAVYNNSERISVQQ
jgi:hypothetical protein